MGLLSRWWEYLRAVPKSLYFNFKYLPVRDAIRLPVLVSHRVHLMEASGSVRIDAPVQPGMIRIGFGEVGIFDRERSRSVWQVTGNVVFRGPAHIGHGSKLSVSGDLTLGPDFTITAESQIVCRKRVEFGRNVLVSWDCLVLDSDFHRIVDGEGRVVNPDADVVLGDDVWIGCRSAILKGTRVGNNVVIAANTCLTGTYPDEGVVVGGAPPRILKRGMRWER